MAKEIVAPWTIWPRRAGVVGALVLCLGALLLSSQTGWLALPGTSSQGPLGPPIKGVALEDRTVVIRVQAPQTGIEIEALAVSQPPEVGRLSVTTSHTLLYVPPPNFTGKVSAGYRACWVGGGCRAGLVAITVRPANDSPVARDDAAVTGQGKTVAIDVLANDSDPDGDRLFVRAVSGRRSAGRMRVAGKWILWTPRPGFRGATNVPYVAVDKHGGASRASATVRVGPSSVAPSTSPDVVEFFSEVGPAGADARRDPFLQPLPPPADNDPPQAARDRVSVPAGGTVIIDVLANDRDPDGDRLAIVSVDAPAGGAAKQVGDRIQFTAPFAAQGDISFSYTVGDRSGATGWSLVSVSVLQVDQGAAGEASSSRSP